MSRLLQGWQEAQGSGRGHRPTAGGTGSPSWLAGSPGPQKPHCAPGISTWEPASQSRDSREGGLLNQTKPIQSHLAVQNPHPALAPGTWCGRGCAPEIVPGSRNASDEDSHWARGVLVWSSWGCGAEGAARIGQRPPIGDRAFSSSAYSWCDVSFTMLDYRSTR